MPVMRTISLLAAALVAALFLAQNREARALDAPRALSGEELQLLLPGNTLIGIDEDGAYWMYYPSEDTLWGRSASGDVDVGRWWIENDSYCRAWRRWFQGQTRCWQLARDGQGELVWYSLRGEKEGRSFVRAGNAIGDLPSEAGPRSQLADAGSGLATSLEAVVAHAVVEPESGIAPRSAQAGGKDPAPAAGPRRGRPVNENPPVVPGQSAKSKSSSASSGAAAASGTAAQSRLGGFLDRLGVRSSTGTSGGDSSGGGGGGSPERGGLDRDRG
jgi:hypothetical protein